VRFSFRVQVKLSRHTLDPGLTSDTCRGPNHTRDSELGLEKRTLGGLKS